MAACQAVMESFLSLDPLGRDATMTRGTSKISVIGCGNVGMKFAFTAVLRGLARELVLVDLDTRRVEGEVMDLQHCSPFTKPVSITAGEVADIKGSSVVVLSAGKKQRPGETRLDLARANAAIFTKLARDVAEYAPDAVILVATNPVDVLAHVTWQVSGFDHRKVIGSGTVLDSARFRHMLASHCVVDPRNVHAYVLGEHGDSEVLAWSSASIGGMPLHGYCPFCARNNVCDKDSFKERVENDVRRAAYEIIDRKSETSSAIGVSLARIVQAVLEDENAILPVSCLVQGYPNVPEVYMSLPAILNRHGIRAVLHVQLDEGESSALATSARVLRETLDGLER